jgi:mannose-1-phosphate guanylyltransferase
MRVMIMAAGIGTRLRPLTDLLPKPMVPIANRPALHHILRLLSRHDLREVVINLHHLPETITDYFGDGTELGMSLSYSYEPELLGTAGGVKNNASFLGRDTFLVMSGDALTDVDLTGLIEAHKQHGSIATMAVKEVDDPSLYGVVVADDEGRVVGFQEKPSREEARSRLCNCGIYVFEPAILDYIPAGRFDDFGKRVFPDLLRDGTAFHAHVVDGYWSDVGNLREYMRGNADALAGRVRVELAGNEIRPGVWVDADSEVAASAHLDPPVVIGRGCRVGHCAYLEGPAAIGDGSMIGDHARLARVVVLAQSEVLPEQLVVEGVIGQGRSLPDAS